MLSRLRTRTCYINLRTVKLKLLQNYRAYQYKKNQHSNATKLAYFFSHFCFYFIIIDSLLAKLTAGNTADICAIVINSLYYIVMLE